MSSGWPGAGLAGCAGCTRGRPRWGWAPQKVTTRKISTAATASLGAIRTTTSAATKAASVDPTPAGIGTAAAASAAEEVGRHRAPTLCALPVTPATHTARATEQQGGRRRGSHQHDQVAGTAFLARDVAGSGRRCASARCVMAAQRWPKATDQDRCGQRECGQRTRAASARSRRHPGKARPDSG